MVGQVRGLWRLEHHHRGRRRPASSASGADPTGQRAARFTLEDLKTEDAPPQRRPTGIAEFDRVTGGGLVPGSALLVGGDPGIGKSTIILQALGEVRQERRPCDLYLRRRGDGAGAHARRPHGACRTRR